jgi:long-subunit acyl-CoA synthetase (AMP-forming)
MNNEKSQYKTFAQTEKEYFEKLFSRRVRDGPLRFQTIEDYTEEMRSIESALRELGVHL